MYLSACCYLPSIFTSEVVFLTVVMGMVSKLSAKWKHSHAQLKNCLNRMNVACAERFAFACLRMHLWPGLPQPMAASSSLGHCRCCHQPLYCMCMLLQLSFPTKTTDEVHAHAPYMAAARKPYGNTDSIIKAALLRSTSQLTASVHMCGVFYTLGIYKQIHPNLNLPLAPAQECRRVVRDACS